MQLQTEIPTEKAQTHTKILTGAFHRHMLCLYGEDEKLLRITAMEMGKPVSHLIRISLYLFLDLLGNASNVSDQELFETGIKFSEQVLVSYDEHHCRPLEKKIRWMGFELNKWWLPSKLIVNLNFVHLIVFRLDKS